MAAAATCAARWASQGSLWVVPPTEAPNAARQRLHASGYDHRVVQMYMSQRAASAAFHGKGDAAALSEAILMADIVAGLHNRGPENLLNARPLFTTSGNDITLHNIYDWADSPAPCVLESVLASSETLAATYAALKLAAAR